MPHTAFHPSFSCRATAVTAASRSQSIANRSNSSVNFEPGVGRGDDSRRSVRRSRHPHETRKSHHYFAALYESREHIALGHYRECLGLAPPDYLRRPAVVALAHGMYRVGHREEALGLLRPLL